MKPRRRAQQENFVWISYSDLSTSLMLCFILFFLVALYERNQEKELAAKNATKAEKNAEFAQTLTKEVYDARNAFIKSLHEIADQMVAQQNQNGCSEVQWNVDEKNNSIQIFCNQVLGAVVDYAWRIWRAYSSGVSTTSPRPASFSAMLRKIRGSSSTFLQLSITV